MYINLNVIIQLILKITLCWNEYKFLSIHLYPWFKKKQSENKKLKEVKKKKKKSLTTKKDPTKLLTAVIHCCFYILCKYVLCIHLLNKETFKYYLRNSGQIKKHYLVDLFQSLLRKLYELFYTDLQQQNNRTRFSARWFILEHHFFDSNKCCCK